MNLLPYLRSVRMSWARPHSECCGGPVVPPPSMVQLEDSFSGAVAPQPALHFNRDGCEELTSLLRLEEAPSLLLKSYLPVRQPRCIEAAGLCSRYLVFVAEKVFMKQINQMQVLT